MQAWLSLGKVWLCARPEALFKLDEGTTLPGFSVWAGLSLCQLWATRELVVVKKEELVRGVGTFFAESSCPPTTHRGPVTCLKMNMDEIIA